MNVWKSLGDFYDQRGKKRIGELKIELNIQSEEQREKLLKTTWPEPQWSVKQYDR